MSFSIPWKYVLPGLLGLILSLLTQSYLSSSSGPVHSYHHAAYQADLTTLTQLLDSGLVLVNDRDQYNNTAVHWASKSLSSRLRSVEVLKFLQSRGAFLNVTNTAGSSPLHWASSTSSDKSSDPGCPVIDFLIASGIGPNVVNSEGESALHWAVDWQQVPAVRCLLQAGADSNLQDVNGNAPLHKLPRDCSSSPECQEIVRLLLAHAGDITKPNNYKRQPLHHFDTSQNAANAAADADADADQHLATNAAASSQASKGKPSILDVENVESYGRGRTNKKKRSKEESAANANIESPSSSAPPSNPPARIPRSLTPAEVAALESEMQQFKRNLTGEGAPSSSSAPLA